MILSPFSVLSKMDFYHRKETAGEENLNKRTHGICFVK
ncbi:hypothetical protein SAMN04515672_4365 [Natronorubrum texcoconense]|uniref:Uncharacterized protein n=1 Tax=Natronorubrum texcoconense TaxID=1095776 RepID=A0A1G9G0Z2_9EURY|nr:hypothetical protein SAMN04515672_4365 [Natronorubrum texcoconense]